MMKPAVALAISALCVTPALADTRQQHSGWAAWFNTDRINEKWGFISDVQLRSGDDLENVQNLLIRPGVTYFLNGQNNVSMGYAYNATLNNPGDNLIEHRIWRQYIHTNTYWTRAAVTHRFRLEQRFSRAGEPQRSAVLTAPALFLSARSLSLRADKASFTTGPFFAFQNEVFLNVQHDENANGELFDQNRILLAGGYRLSSRYDLELGYLNQYINGRASDIDESSSQLALYSRF